MIDREVTVLSESTLCYSCGDMVIELAHRADINLLADYKGCEQKEQDVGKQAISCACCQEVIGEGETYYILTADRYVLIDIADEVGNQIEACEHCEGEDRNHFAYLMNQDGESEYMAPGGISMSEYLSYQGVAEELSALICEYIKCPRCHYGRDGDTRKNPSAGIFTLDDEVYTRREINEFWGFDDDLFCNFAEKYGVIIEISELNELRHLLSINPMMAMRNVTAQKIYQTLQAHKECGHADRLTNKSGKLYRGRNRKRDSNKRFKCKEMYSPPLGSASHGRYNAIGVSVLYVANTLNAIPHEIHPAHDEVIDIGEIRITTELDIFDLGEFDHDFQGFFNEKNEETKPVKQAYLLTNFIGACCTDIGYHGVKYDGVHNDNMKYINYALFNIDHAQDVIVKSVKTYEPRFTIDMNVVPAPPRIKKSKHFDDDPTKYF